MDNVFTTLCMELDGCALRCAQISQILLDHIPEDEAGALTFGAVYNLVEALKAKLEAMSASIETDRLTDGPSVAPPFSVVGRRGAKEEQKETQT